VVDQAGGTDEEPAIPGNFQSDTCSVGPDSAQCAQCVTKPNGERYLLVRDRGRGQWYLAEHRLDPILPALRHQNKTSFGLQDTIYLRNEGDTLHMNSIAIFHSGGSDIDSKYAVKASPSPSSSAP
jgi:hypothetical protein